MAEEKHAQVIQAANAAWAAILKSMLEKLEGTRKGLYKAAEPAPPGPTDLNAPPLTEAEWRRFDPANRPAAFLDDAGQPIMRPSLNAMQIFQLLPQTSLKDTVEYFKKRSGVPREQAAALYLAGFARDFSEYIRVSNYGPGEMARWWRETTLTSAGQAALDAFYGRYDKKGLFG